MNLQLIETAPKDGTEILVYLEVAGQPVIHLAWYRSEKEWEEGGKYCGGWENLAEWEGWWSYTEGSVTQKKLDGCWGPTHWAEFERPATLLAEEAKE
jgi:hypothetical protein